MSSLSHVIASQGHFDYFGKYAFQQWVENVNFTLTSKGYSVVLYTNGETKNSYKKGNITVETSQKVPFMVDPFSPVTLIRLFVSKKPDLVIIHGLQHILTLFSIIQYSLRRVPTYVIVHGLYPKNSLITNIRDSVIKFLLKKCSCTLVALTNYDKNCLLMDWKIDPAKIKVSAIPLYINQEELTLIQILKDQDLRSLNPVRKIITVLFVGRLSKEKRVDMLVRSISKLRDAGATMYLKIVGDGPERSKLISMVQALNLSTQIEFTGALNHKEIWKYFITSDVFVLPSEHEGFPRVILEAFACGTPVIASNICGIPEIISDGENGMLFSTEQELTNRLFAIHENRTLLSSMTQKIAADQKYLLMNNIEKLCKVLNC